MTSSLESLDIYCRSDPHSTRPWISLVNHQEIYHLLHLIELLPYKPWNWDLISARPDIEMDDILSHSSLPWSLRGMSAHPHLCFSHIRLLSFRFHTQKWDFFKLSQHPRILSHHIWGHPAISWDMDAVSVNPNISIVDIISHPSHPWNFDHLSFNSGISVEEMITYEEYPWNYSMLSYNLSLTPYQIRDLKRHHPHIYKQLNWSVLSLHPNITPEWIHAHPRLPWNYAMMSLNPNLDLSFVYQHRHCSWDWRALSYHPNISPEQMMEHPDLPWEWDYVHYNPHLTVSFILSHPTLVSWDISRVSSSIQATYEEIYEYRDWKWDWDALSGNHHLFSDTELEMMDSEHMGWEMNTCIKDFHHLHQKKQGNDSISDILADVLCYPCSIADCCTRTKLYLRTIKGFPCFFHRGRFHWMISVWYPPYYPSIIKDTLIEQLHTKFPRYKMCIDPTERGWILDINPHLSTTKEKGYKTYQEMELILLPMLEYLNELMVI